MTKEEFEQQVSQSKARAAELRQEIATAQAEGRFGDIAGLREELSHIVQTARRTAAMFHHNRLHALNREIDSARKEEAEAERELKPLRRVWNVCFKTAAETVDGKGYAKRDCLEVYRDDDGFPRSTCYEWVREPLEKCRAELEALNARIRDAGLRASDARKEIAALGNDGPDFAQAVVEEIEAEAETAEAEAV